MAREDLAAFCRRELFSDFESPYFRVEFPPGYAIDIEYANSPDNHEPVYLLRSAAQPEPICLGKGGGHWLLPCFRWRELLELRKGILPTRGRNLSGAALLLFFPATWLTAADDYEEVRQVLLQASDALGLTSDQGIEHEIDQLVGNNKTDIRWSKHHSLGWINNGPNSRRNPKSSASLKPEEFLELTRFMVALGCD
jgi:hypothetical protein